MYINPMESYKTNLLGSTLIWPEQVTVVLDDFGADCADLLMTGSLDTTPSGFWTACLTGLCCV